MNRTLIKGGTVVLESESRDDCDLLIENGKIVAIGSLYGTVDAMAIDARDAFIMPGIIDLHTDALESEITPRPGANFPLDVALQEIDTKMLACGITTVFHSLHFGYDAATLNSKSKYSRHEVIEATYAFAKRHALTHARIHLRFEILGVRLLEELRALLGSGMIDLLSFMDHTPGQGQYPREEYLRRRMSNGLSETEALAQLEQEQGRPKATPEQLASIAALADRLGIPVASHDDDSPAKVERNAMLGVAICEFPVNLPAAERAKQLGLATLGGASNILRGGSLSGNLCMQEAVCHGVLDGLCSDYYPPSILHSVFKLYQQGALSLADAVRLATLNPAKAARIDPHTGSIEEEKDADVIVVSLEEQRPRVTHCLSRGRLVYQSHGRVAPALAKALPTFRNRMPVGS